MSIFLFFRFFSVHSLLAQICLITCFWLLLPMEQAAAQVPCASSGSGDTISADSIGDLCTVTPFSSVPPTPQNGFEITQPGGDRFFDVVAYLNGSSTAPTVTCSFPANGGTVSPSPVPSATRISLPISNSTTSCSIQYQDEFGEQVNFSFSISPVFIFSVYLQHTMALFTPSTGGFDTIAPTVSVGGLNPTGNGTVTVPITFSEDIRGFDPTDLVVTGGTVSSISGSNGNYVATIVPNTSGPISVNVPANVVVDQGQNPNSASNTPSISSSFTTEILISSYLQSRATAILQSQVDLTDFVNPIPTGQFSLRGQGTSDAGDLELSGALGGLNSGLQVWAKVSGAWAETELTQSSFFTTQTGIHSFVSSSFILGAMVQIDWTEGESNEGALASDFDGWGWLAGPYLAGKLPDQPLYFEARLAYGQSYNEISPFGTYSDDFSTERWLATGRIEGEITFGDWSVNPAVRVSYFREEQEAYFDTPGNPVLGQTIAQGEMEFGPTIRRNFALDGGNLQAELGVEGIWLFASDAGIAINRAVLNEDELRAKLSAALRFDTTTGWDITGDLHYDGIGAEDYEAIGGGVKILRAF